MMEFLTYVNSLITPEIIVLMIGVVLGYALGYIRGTTRAWDDAHEAYRDVYMPFIGKE